jgi:formylglycine-generating enzyme required for sulfatase activity
MMIKIEMVEVPSSQDQKIGSFEIGKYPVTQEQYQAVMGVNPSYFQGNPQNPVEMVSWDDAQAFCIKLNGVTGHKYRLPTQEEWEYACRAGTTTDYYFGDDANQLGDYAWYEDNSGLITYPVGAAKSPNAWLITHPVGQKLPNAWGLYDMSGNVWEWCIDKWLRGGSWNDPPYCCRSANRDSSPPRGLRFNNVGFRVAQTIRPTLLAEEMWEAQLDEPHKDMILSEVVEYLETLQTKEERGKLLTAIYWSGFQTSLDHIDDYSS